MNTFDSITLLLANIPNQDVELSEFFNSTETKTTFQVKKAHLSPGINQISYDALKQELRLAISSKLLGADYFRLISQDTLPDLYSKLMALNLFRFDWQELLDATVLKFDVTVDIPCTDQVSEVINSMQAYASRLYRVTDPYRNSRGQKTSIEFFKNRKSAVSKVRLLAYSKADELPKNQEFLNSLTQAEQSQLFTQASNLLRLESSFSNFQKMRNHLLIQTNTLHQVLASKANPIQTILKEIVMKAPISQNTKLPLNPDETSVKELHLYCTLAHYHFDLAAIRAAYKARDPKNAARLMAPLEELYARLPAYDPGPVAKVLDYLDYCY